MIFHDSKPWMQAGSKHLSTNNYHDLLFVYLILLHVIWMVRTEKSTSTSMKRRAISRRRWDAAATARHTKFLAYVLRVGATASLCPARRHRVPPSFIKFIRLCPQRSCCPTPPHPDSATLTPLLPAPLHAHEALPPFHSLTWPQTPPGSPNHDTAQEVSTTL